MQDQTENVHRMELLPINCDDDDMARRDHAKDAKELFISEVLDHEGEPQKRSTIKFRCMVRGHSKPLYLISRIANISQQSENMLRRILLYIT